jgi:hypothetical protein
MTITELMDSDDIEPDDIQLMIDDGSIAAIIDASPTGDLIGALGSLGAMTLIAQVGAAVHGAPKPASVTAVEALVPLLRDKVSLRIDGHSHGSKGPQ